MIRKITVGDYTFSVNALFVRPCFYLRLIKPLFRESVFAQKATEDFQHYLSRLFNLLYKRANNSTNRSINSNQITVSEKCESVLSTLGIDIIKKCPQKSKVIFKSTGKSYKMNNASIVELADSINKVKHFDITSLDESSLKIGVELEFIGKRNNLTEFICEMKRTVGSSRFEFTDCYNKNKGKTWVLGRDGSIHPRGTQNDKMEGYELTSPILHLDNKYDFEELETVCNLIKTVFGGKTNKSCGTHIHMSFPVNCAVEEWLIKCFAMSYNANEVNLFDKVVPVERQADNAKYSGTVSIKNPWARYSKLNFCNTSILNDKNILHLEFRQLDGTLDFNKIKTWVKLQKFFIELTLKSCEKQFETYEPEKVNLNDVIISEVIGVSETEELMKMAKMIA